MASKTTYVSDVPRLMELWDHSSNVLLPQNVSHRSNVRVRWLCSKKHSWSAVVRSVEAGTGCPYCSGRKAVPGQTDLPTTHPHLVSSYSSKNTTPIQEVKAGSSLKRLWICDEGHEWWATVQDVSSGKWCPFCSGRRSIPGKTDLQTLYPDIAVEWAEDNEKPASEYRPSSRYKATWICRNGHKWVSAIYSRTGKNKSGCRICSLSVLTKPEKLLGSLLGGVHQHRIFLENKSVIVDLYLADSNTIVEYDGWYWHKDHQHRDTTKTEALLGAGYRVVRIRESYRSKVLPMLPIEHENLYQVNCDYDDLLEDVASATATVVEWICKDGNTHGTTLRYNT